MKLHHYFDVIILNFPIHEVFEFKFQPMTPTRDMNENDISEKYVHTCTYDNQVSILGALGYEPNALADQFLISFNIYK